MSRDSKAGSDHFHGWFICAGKRKVAELDYVGIDGFMVKFRVTPLIENGELSPLLRELSDKSRDPADYYTFLNRSTGQEVADVDFLVGSREGEDIVVVRDQRLPSGAPLARKGWMGRVLEKWF